MFNTLTLKSVLVSSISYTALLILAENEALSSGLVMGKNLDRFKLLEPQVFKKKTNEYMNSCIPQYPQASGFIL